MGKPKVLFWVGNRKRDLLATDEDVKRLEAEASLSIVQGAPNMPAGDVVEQSRGAVAVISSWGAPDYTADVLGGCPDLRMFARIGGSVKNVIDLSAWDRGIRVVSSVDAQGFLVADLTLSLMLAGLHRLPFYVRQQWGGGPLDRAIDPERVPQRSLIRRQVGLLGFGAIARHVARLLQPFLCRVRACDPYVPDKTFQFFGVERVGSVHELCAQSEVLSIHAPFLPQTEGILSREAIDCLQPGVLVVNTSYGELIDMPALEERLREGTLFACLDMVAGGMPGGLDSLRYYPNCFITPTVSGNSDGIALMSRQVIDEVIRFLRGQPLQFELVKGELATRA